MLKPRATRDPRLQAPAFRDALVGWFSHEGRDYPWRRTTDPYAILVSEVMLQQTQIATVLGKNYYGRFLERFPDPAALAAAEDAELLKAWEGLGYYRRVRMLRETARAVNAAGGFPGSVETLQDLPGVGRYTANALQAFARDLPAAVVDGNVARVLSRIADDPTPVDSPAGLKRLWELAGELADPGRPRAYNSALMELGQRICRPGVPDCLACPVSSFCATRNPETLPVKATKMKIERVDAHVVWSRDSEGRILLQQEQGKRRQGLWKLPAREPAELAGCPEIATSAYTITRFRVTLHMHEAAPGHPAATPRESERRVAAEDLQQLPMPSPYRKALNTLMAVR